MKCEQCGSEMNYSVKDHTCCWICPGCGWGLAATYNSPIELDFTEYTISISQASAPNIHMIKCVSKLLSYNYVQAKDALEHGTGILKGTAKHIKRAAEQLSDAGITYSIQPDFPY